MGRRMLAAWRRYWFTPGSLTDLGVSRVVLAAIILWVDGTTRALYAAWMSPDYWNPIPAFRLLGIAQPSLATLEWVSRANLVLLVAVLLGTFTRTALALLLPLQLFIEALPNCFGKVSHGTIPVLYAVLFFLLAPCDRGFALGGVWRRARAAARSPGPPPPRTSPFARWPLDLLFIELAAYYFVAGVSKLRDAGFAWVDGYTLQYHLLNLRMETGARLAEHLWLCSALSVLVLGFELSYPLGVVRRLRPLVLGGGLVFHLGTRYFLNIWFWPIVSLYLLFIPWTRMGTALARVTGFSRASLVVHHDTRCAACRRTVSVLRDLDLAGKLRFVDPSIALGSGGPSHLTVGPGGLPGLRRLARALPAAWPILPLLYLPGVRWLGRRVNPLAHGHARSDR